MSAARADSGNSANVSKLVAYTARMRLDFTKVSGSTPQRTRVQVSRDCFKQVEVLKCVREMQFLVLLNIGT